jgi:hypothetical protein
MNTVKEYDALDMRTNLRIFWISIIFFLVTAGVSQANVPDALVLAFKTGNYRELGKYLNESIELAILENEHVYSKSQAELLLKDFFSKYPPSNFVIIHEGGKEGSRYAIGTLTTAKGEFRIYFLLKAKDSIQVIQQLRIEQ